MRNGGLRQSVLLQEGKRQLEMERLCLIDVSAEDDSLIPSVSDDLGEKALPELVENDDLLETHLSPFGDDANGRHDSTTSSGMNKEQSTLSKEPSPSKRAGIGPVKSSLRKSLAWDKAFFTDEGVLNSEELALVNKTFKMPKEELLPGIKEETRISVESNGSLVSSDLTLQDLEEKLFEQKQQNSDEQIDMTTTGNKLVAIKNNGEGDIYGIHDMAIISNRKGRSKLHSENEPTKRQGIISISNRTGGTNETNGVQPNPEDQINMTTGNKLLVSKKNSEGEIYACHDVAIINNRTGGSKLHSENEADKRQGFVSTGSRTGGTRHEMDKVRKKSIVEQRHSPPKAKSSVRENRNSTKPPVDSSNQKGPRCQAPCPMTAKKSNMKTKEFQKSHVKQPMSLSANDGSSTSGSFTKRISSVSKCVKDTLGKVLPANMGKISGHKFSPRNAQDDFRISAKSISAPNSSASESPSPKLSRCHSYSFERFAKPVSERAMEAASGIQFTNSDSLAYFTDDSSSIFHSSLSPGSSFDGMSSVSSPTHSTSSTISPSKLNINDVSCDNQNASVIDVGFSVDEHVSKGRLQKQGLQSKVPVADEATSTNIMHRPAVDDLNMACSTPRDSLIKDNSCSSGSSQLRANLSRPSGLRMPSPKIGFFDTGNASFVRDLSTSYEKSTGYVLEKKTLPPGIPACPPRFSPGGQGDIHRDSKLKPHGFYSTRPPFTSVNLSIRPSYGCALPCTIPSPFHNKSGTVFKSRIPSSLSQACQPRLNSNPGLSSDLPLLVPQKDESSVKPHQNYCNQKSDVDQLSLEIHQKVVNAEENEEDFVTEDIQSKLHLQLSNGEVCKPKGTSGPVAKRNSYQLDFSGEISPLQVGSETLGCEAISAKGLETTRSIMPDKAADGNTVVAAQPLDHKELSFSSDKKIRCEFDCAKGQLSPSANQVETQNATEKDVSNFPLDSTSKIDLETEQSYSFQNEQKVDASEGCRPVDKSAENRISNSVCGSKSSNEDKLLSTIEWPVYEDVKPVSPVELNLKGDSSPTSMKLQKQHCLPINESKTIGRIPLSDNCTLPITSDHQELQKQLKKEKGSIFAFAVKAARRLTTSPVSSPVFAEISEQENYMPEEQYLDSPLNKNRRRKSVQGQCERKEEIKNSVDASTIMEKSSLEFLSEESLILGKGSVQNSISST